MSNDHEIESLKQEINCFKIQNKENATRLESLESLLRKANDELKDYKLKYSTSTEEVFSP
jgi:hypothetical protein